MAVVKLARFDTANGVLRGNATSADIPSFGVTEWDGLAAPDLSAAGKARIYFDSTANKFKVSEHAGAYADLVYVEKTFSGSVTTTDATQTTVATLSPTDNAVVMVRAVVAARQSGGSNGAGYELIGTFRRAGATTTQIGVTNTLIAQEDAGAASWDVAFTISGADIRVGATGVAATTINWKANASYTEVT